MLALGFTSQAGFLAATLGLTSPYGELCWRPELEIVRVSVVVGRRRESAGGPVASLLPICRRGLVSNYD
jgi:hypothetical protein